MRIFGHSEFLLAVLKARSLLRSIFLSRPQATDQGWNDSVHLQGTREWGLLWEMLTECAAKLDFVQLRLDVNVPVLGEGYHGSWSRPTKSEPNRLWRLDLPLIAEKRVLGYVKVVGERDGVGGHKGGTEAAQATVDGFAKHLQSAPAKNAIQALKEAARTISADLRTRAAASESLAGMNPWPPHKLESSE